jgi:hypothetical protein
MVGLLILPRVFRPSIENVHAYFLSSPLINSETVKATTHKLRPVLLIKFFPADDRYHALM